MVGWFGPPPFFFALVLVSMLPFFFFFFLFPCVCRYSIPTYKHLLLHPRFSKLREIAGPLTNGKG